MKDDYYGSGRGRSTVYFSLFLLFFVSSLCGGLIYWLLQFNVTYQISDYFAQQEIEFINHSHFINSTSISNHPLTTEHLDKLLTLDLLHIIYKYDANSLLHEIAAKLSKKALASAYLLSTCDYFQEIRSLNNLSSKLELYINAPKSTINGNKFCIQQVCLYFNRKMEIATLGNRTKKDPYIFEYISQNSTFKMWFVNKMLDKAAGFYYLRSGRNNYYFQVFVNNRLGGRKCFANIRFKNVTLELFFASTGIPEMLNFGSFSASGEIKVASNLIFKGTFNGILPVSGTLYSVKRGYFISNIDVSIEDFYELKMGWKENGKTFITTKDDNWIKINEVNK